MKIWKFIHPVARAAATCVGCLLASNTASITTNITTNIAAAEPSKAPSTTAAEALDRYGGYLAVSAEATGFFRVENIDGRWWLVTPEGHGFLSAGMNHVDYKEDYSPEFVRFVTSHLKDWGFNTVGWSQELTGRNPDTRAMVHSRGWGPEQYRGLGMPYTHLIRFTDVEWYVDEQFPEVFSDAFARKCDRLAGEVCEKLRDDPNLIGYFYADTPNWPLWAEKVGHENLRRVADKYYQVIHDSIRRYDPNHLLLGDRYKGDRVIPIRSKKVNGLPDDVLDAMKPTVDVLSIEYYRPDVRIEEDLAAWHARSGKPVLMADSAFFAETDALHPSPKTPLYTPDQAARGEAYRLHARRLYSNPLVIGYHWCAFGQSAERHSGVLDGHDRPYDACVDRMRRFNRRELYTVGASAAAASASSPLKEGKGDLSGGKGDLSGGKGDLSGGKGDLSGGEGDLSGGKGAMGGGKGAMGGLSALAESLPYKGGQAAHGTRNGESRLLQRTARDDLTEATPGPSRADLLRDGYGGTTLVTTKASGYFRTQRIDGRWWFVTPSGHGFLSIGINHLDLAALKHPDNIHVFNQRYGRSDERLIREGMAAPLRDWGFNTIGWTQELVAGVWGKPGSVLRHSHEWSHAEFQTAALPYVYNLKFADIENFNSIAVYPDVFDEDFANWADYLARSVCVGMASEPLLLGYADVPVPAITDDKPGSWAEGLDLDDPEDLAKLQRIVRRYFEVTTAAIRRYDPNHLLFGPRFGRPADTPDWLIELAGEYFDVILSNRYVTAQQVAEDLGRWHALSGKPILISDMLYLAPTELLKVGRGAACYVPDQKARGEAYQRFAQAAFRNPYVVGLHWCAFLENRCRKSGLKNYLDEPYTDCVERMGTFNRDRLYRTALEGPGR